MIRQAKTYSSYWSFVGWVQIDTHSSFPRASSASWSLLQWGHLVLLLESKQGSLEARVGCRQIKALAKSSRRQKFNTSLAKKGPAGKVTGRRDLLRASACYPVCFCEAVVKLHLKYHMARQMMEFLVVKPLFKKFSRGPLDNSICGFVVDHAIGEDFVRLCL